MGNALGIAVPLGVSALPLSGPALGYLFVAVVGLLWAITVGRPAGTRRAE
ncbi:hypothetical protein ODJ79_42330 [Actinoplanes sp. KI2]|nr:hypothetical protein [Actinoplanes sp. KI2]MCU7730396.1 hypothetical protein [Actinoplanes sp. KI2]